MTTYKPHYACFDCRKTFKRFLLKDIRKGIKEVYSAKCPQCGNLTADMGLDFESPKKNDLRSWESMRNLYSVGVTFHSCGCSGPGFIPQSSEQLLDYLKGKQQTYVSNLRFWLNKKDPTNKKEIEAEKRQSYNSFTTFPPTVFETQGYVKSEKAITFWNEKLAEIEKHIKLITEKINS